MSDSAAATSSGLHANLSPSTSTESLAPNATADLATGQTPAEPSHRSRLTPRVSQIDAQELDDGLVGMLGGRLRAAGAVFGSHHPASRILNGSSLQLLLQLVIYRLGVMGGTSTDSGSLSRATPGMRLQSLQLELDEEPGLVERSPIRNETSSPASRLARAIYLHPLLTLILPFAFNKLRDAHSRATAPQASRNAGWLGSSSLDAAIERVAWAASSWQLVGWLTFLWDGRYPSLTSRLLRLRMVPSDPSGQVARLVSYEFMNRQLVWHGFTEFLLVLLPMLRSRRPALQRAGRRMVARIARLLRSLDGKRFPRDYNRLPSDKPTPSPTPPGPYHSLPRKYCAICYQRLRPGVDHELGLPTLEDPTLAPTQPLEGALLHVPARGNCADQCTYCYHCLAGVIAQQAIAAREDLQIRSDDNDSPICGWPCLRCGHDIWQVSRS